MSQLLNALIQGALLGGNYALLACGLAFMYQVMRIINLAHGTLIVVAAFAFWFLADRWGINPFVALLGVLPAMAVIGWGLERAVFAPSVRYGLLVPILATFGLAILVNNLLFEQFGANPRSLAPYIGALSYGSWALGGDIYLGQLAVLIFAVAVALLAGLSLFLSKTLTGRAIRATAVDRDTVGLIGVNPRKVNAIAAAIAMVTVGIAGLFLGMRGSFTPYSGMDLLIFAFEAAVIGGTGSLWRTLLGGVLLGVVQSLGALANPQAFLIAGHCLFLAVVVGQALASGRSFGHFAKKVRGWI
ncbi:MAG TPA: branched-chain amino acid ABC transporter permease [Rhodanobacteraceae bacterium]|nr:branched-chain amino acid ABC transporter permease [Rhodanobacteraceae bacterium]